jgi:radical SAM superfamily enzyme YgiQ (UPF0313 family)
MRVVLLQLPIQGHDFFFSKENIPLAAACLKAIGDREGLEIEIVPRFLMSYGSDRSLLDYLREAKPDIVGMSCYLWNLDRSLFLARQIKRHLPECAIVLGGPEITPDNGHLLQSPGMDVGIIGEAEAPWSALLKSYPRIPESNRILIRGEDGRLRPTGKTNALHRALDFWPSPYLFEVLDPQLDGVLWLETVRGCVHRCAYCYYHKQFSGLRAFPLDRIMKEVRRALDRNVSEIVFLDPCFSRRPGLEVLLDGLGAMNTNRALRFSAEANAEEIDPAMAKMMASAGFSDLEVGLQSVGAATLRRIHRRFQPERFLGGVRSLRDSGIRVMVDLIAGLPGDTLGDIRRSIDWVLEREAYDYLMLYPLSLLPATELKQRSLELGLEAMPHPPYLVTRGPGLSAAEIRESFHYYEQSMEQDISPLERPPCFDSTFGLSKLPRELSYSFNWDEPGQVHSFLRNGDPKAYAITIRMSKEILMQPVLWGSILREYLRQNPFSLVSIEVPAGAFREDLQPLWRIARGRKHPVDFDYTVTHTPYRSLFLFSRKRETFWTWPDPREWRPIKLPDAQKLLFHPTCLVATPEGDIPRWLIDHMATRYRTLPEFRVWEPADEES